jgi:hypothetical protein
VGEGGRDDLRRTPVSGNLYLVHVLVDYCRRLSGKNMSGAALGELDNFDTSLRITVRSEV